MAVVRPLRGIRYDPARVALGRVLAPPYDVISDADRDELYARDPHNIVRIDFGAPQPDDIEGVDDRYTRARGHLDGWLRLGLLRRDQAPAIHVHDHTFPGGDGQTRTRRGLLARVRALPWDRSDVLPHERTLRGPKEDRLRLMRATAAQTSGVFLIWDRAPGLAEKLALATARAADVAAEGEGERGPESHRLWVVDDPAEVAGIVEALSGARLYMADGHHRFETAAAYAEERRSADPAAPEDADFLWTLAWLCDAADPALEVLPTHRLVRPAQGVPATVAELVRRLPERFAVTPQPTLAAATASAAARRNEGHAIAVGAADGAVLLVASRDPHASPRDRLDVSVVQDAILAGACGLDQERIAGGALAFARRVADAEAAVRSGEAALAICVNGCTTREMIEVSDAGDQMPQKSTYFVPKVPTGLVINPL